MTLMIMNDDMYMLFIKVMLWLSFADSYGLHDAPRDETVLHMEVLADTVAG